MACAALRCAALDPPLSSRRSSVAMDRRGRSGRDDDDHGGNRDTQAAAGSSLLSPRLALRLCFLLPAVGWSSVAVLRVAAASPDSAASGRMSRSFVVRTPPLSSLLCLPAREQCHQRLLHLRSVRSHAPHHRSFQCTTIQSMMRWWFTATQDRSVAAVLRCARCRRCGALFARALCLPRPSSFTPLRPSPRLRAPRRPMRPSSGGAGDTATEARRWRAAPQQRPPRRCPCRLRLESMCAQPRAGAGAQHSRAEQSDANRRIRQLSDWLRPSSAPPDRSLLPA